MRLGTLRTPTGPRVVAVSARGWLDVGRCLQVENEWATDLRALIAAEDVVLPKLRERLAEVEAGGGDHAWLHEPDEALLGPPVPEPRRILCIGFNYLDHAHEAGFRVPKAPEVFLRLPSTLVGPRDEVWLPPESEQVDLEAELAVVIGRGGRRIPREEALAAVFGWSVFNDISVRDYQARGTQWTPGKNFERTAPFGPFVVTCDELPDPSRLEVGSAVDDVEMQRSDTSHLIFDIPALISDLSTFTTLEPGDVIATGTPPGTGVGRTPPRWLRAGEEVRCWVAGVGELRNRLVPEPAGLSR